MHVHPGIVKMVPTVTCRVAHFKSSACCIEGDCIHLPAWLLTHKKQVSVVPEGQLISVTLCLMLADCILGRVTELDAQLASIEITQSHGV